LFLVVELRAREDGEVQSRSSLNYLILFVKSSLVVFVVGPLQFCGNVAF
jgi:hypothetical protein